MTLPALLISDVRGCLPSDVLKTAVMRNAFSPSASLWILCDDDNAAEWRLEVKLFAVPRSWVIWYHGLCSPVAGGLDISKDHLLYFTGDKKKYTFNRSEILVPSARQAVYGDKRAKAGGRLPDDTWLIGSVPGSTPAEPPIIMWQRIVASCSNKGDKVWCDVYDTSMLYLACESLGRLITHRHEPVLSEETR